MIRVPFLNALDLARQKFRNALPYVDSELSKIGRTILANTLANETGREVHCLRSTLGCFFYL